MTTEEWSYLPQGVNYLGFLETKLRDLRGIATLIYELIQNADDVKDEEGQPGASQISFDIRKDALVVENDGVFRELDFQRMQNIASGGKRDEEGTTGTFGIGFIAVYQITDHPELFSSSRHWIIRPENPVEGHRIKQRKHVETKGTRFHLPWAFDPDSAVRRKLRIEAVQPEQLSDFELRMGRAISLAALFLKQLKVLELKREGRLVKRIEREIMADDCILIKDGDQTAVWHIFRGSFHDEAERLRRSFRQIEAKKRGDALVAIPGEELKMGGRLFAVLPSRTTIPLPFHVNANFFPSSDRTRIIFGTDYQSEWNRAAVRAAAQALASGLDRLPQLLGHKGLWQLLQSLAECDREVTQGKHDPVFAAFWEEVAAGLSTMPIVFTTTGRWVTPGEARLLSNEEQEAASVLDGLGIQIVHPELRPFRNLLRRKEIGTPRLSVQDVAQGLKRIGLNKRTPLDRAPSCLRTVEAWQKLWRALDVLFSSTSKNERELVNGMLRSSIIALGDDGALWPPMRLFRGDPETKALFKGIHWLGEHNELDSVPARLVPAFTVARAIAFLSDLPAEELKAACCKGELDVRALYRWFEARKTVVTSSQKLITELRALPIWPVASEFRSLDGLYIPGGFDDPLHLSELVNVEALGGRKEFLKDLGVPELTFRVYVRKQVPRVLEERPDLPVEARRRLVQLLAQRLGKIQGDGQLRYRLRNLKLVECTDGHFRPAHQVYLQSEVLKILGDRVYVAVSVGKNAEAVVDLHRWLGGAEEPRPDDVLARVREFSQGPVNEEAKETVETVFEYLVNGWMMGWGDKQKQQYASLQHLAWLPGTRDERRWYRPGELYATFQRHLFETQANFLHLPPTLQKRAGAVKLLESLEIRDTPSLSLVVQHLLLCNKRERKVNKKVYWFLNKNADEPALDQLKDRACLLLPGGGYVRPDQVYWNAHPFGPFRYRLGRDFQQYGNLLDRLGVQEGPGNRDYIQVLIEISEQYGGPNKPLDDDAHAVLMRCWEALSEALEMEQIDASSLAELREYKVIPDARRVLNRPEYMLFEDRAGLAAKFHQFLENSVIKRRQGAWQAMAAVGVRLLSQAVEVHLVEPPDSAEDVELTARVSERRLLINRIIESEKVLGVDGLGVAVLDRLSFERARELVIQYSLKIFRQRYVTDPESVPALLIPGESTLYTVYENGRTFWPAVARELAYAIKPVGVIGGLASGIRDALTNDSFDEAIRTLDELGYPPLEQRKEVKVSESDIITDFGGVEASGEGEMVYQSPSEQPEAKKTKDEPSNGKLSPEEAFEALLDGQRTDHTPVPDPAPERPVGESASDDDRRGKDRIGTGSKKPSRPSGDGKRRLAKRKSQSRLRSYVVHDGGEKKDDIDTISAKRRYTVSQAGVKRVLVHERACGRTPTEMPHYNKGYDVKSLGVGGSVRYIEVKSLSGEWSRRNAAGLTKPQFETARTYGEQFWLYVVEWATEDKARIHCIQDPANQVNQYLFDDGWDVLAETG